MCRYLKLPGLLAALASIFFSPHAASDDVITGKDIPQLLGVWYGQYHSQDTGQNTEIWLEVAFQKPRNGYEIRGFTRWHTLSGTDTEALGPKSKGIGAEHFDTVDGRISQDGNTVNFTEDHSRNTIDAQMHGPESMRVEVTLPESQDATYVFTLDLIDTHYSPSDATRMGVDISHHSGDVDWAAVREAGFSFAYVKASEGVDNLDPRFEDHWAQLKALDFPRGAYHFYVTEDDPVEQAKFFASRLKDDPGTLPPVVDVELLGKNTEGDMTETLLSFLKTLEAETGLRPMIYTSPNFWDRYYRPEFSNYHLWLSEVGVVMPKVPFGWRNWTLWQRKINQSLEGVEKDADISILHPELDLEDIDLEPNTKTR
jgi:lysozyme